MEIEGKTKKWGTSLAFVIPKEIAKKQRLRSNQKLRVLIIEENNTLKETFGMLKNWKKPTEQIMREIDKELWEE